MHQSPVDRPGACDHSVSGNLLIGHAEIRLPVLGESAKFIEASCVGQRRNSFASRELLLLTLFGEPIFAATLLDTIAVKAQFCDQAFHRFCRFRRHR